MATLAATRSKSSSSFHSRALTSATICWASTSSGRSGITKPIEFAAVDAVDQRCAFDKIVARQRKQAALGRAVDRMSRAADPLQEAGDGTGRADLADEVDLADIDAELQRGGCHQAP